MSIGFWQIAIVVILVVLLFGRGKISSLMGDVAKGIKSFKKGMATDATEDSQPKNISENQDSDKNKIRPKGGKFEIQIILTVLMFNPGKKVLC